VAITEEAPVVLNAGASGYYRSRYGVTETKALADHVDELDAAERAALLSDGWALLLSSQISASSSHDWRRSRQPRRTDAVGHARERRRLHRPGSAERATPRFAAKVREIFEPQYRRLGWDATTGESELTPQLRALVLSTLGTTGANEEIKAEAVKRFEANDINGDLANAILRVVAAQDRPGDYETFIERYRGARVPKTSSVTCAD